MKVQLVTRLRRRIFLQRMLLSVPAFFGVGALMSACGGSSSSSPSTSGGGTPTSSGNCSANGTSLETTGLSEGHTHTISISAAEIHAANTGAVFVTSSVGHTHNVQLTAVEYTNLQANQGVSLTTGAATTDGHTHTVTFNCA
jgi:hypothetical protein